MRLKATTSPRWSLEFGPRVKLFESLSALNASTLGPSLRDSISKVWPEIERLSHTFANQNKYCSQKLFSTFFFFFFFDFGDLECLMLLLHFFLFLPPRWMLQSVHEYFE